MPATARTSGLTASLTRHTVAKTARVCLDAGRQDQRQANPKPQTNIHNIMKTILTLIATAAVLSSSAFAAEKCADCAKCCKAETKTCTKSCCKK